jgi:hypothetical protein
MPTYEVYDVAGTKLNVVRAVDESSAMTHPQSSYATLIDDDVAQNLADWRATSVVYRRAFMLALRYIPAPTDAFPHMLAALDDAVANEVIAEGDYGDLGMAVRDVTKFERNHPDMVVFATKVGITTEQVDQIFIIAMRIQSGELS